jgi:hypothetical protein
MERDRQGIPGKDGLPTPMSINDGMTGNLKKPGHERDSTWLVAGECLQSLEKDLLGQISRIVIGLQACTHIVIHTWKVALIEESEHGGVGL